MSLLVSFCWEQNLARGYRDKTNSLEWASGDCSCPVPAWHCFLVEPGMVTRLVGIFCLSGTTPPPFQIKLQILLVSCSEELLMSPLGKAASAGLETHCFCEHSCAEDGDPPSLCYPPHSRTPCSLPQPKLHHGVTQCLAGVKRKATVNQ